MIAIDRDEKIAGMHHEALTLIVDGDRGAIEEDEEGSVDERWSCALLLHLLIDGDVYSHDIVVF